jgi:crotonobetainyl-CoA:carnitine CoA-transferase CaiB-like acyl-CoA transferase
MGYDGDHPSLTGTAFLDPAGGLHGAAAALTALYLREVTGEAQYVEVPQVEAALHWIGPQILAAEAGAAPAPPAGNEVPAAAPHDAYRCAGDDEWVAIEVRDRRDWSLLCAVIGRPDLGHDPALASPAGRRERPGVIRAAIEAWSAQFTKEGAARQLQRGGVIAAPVATGADVAQDPHLWARGFFTALDHPDAGRHFYPGVAVRAGVTPRPLGRAAPRLGADNAAALALFGLSAAEAAELERQGVTATRPAGR